ncbi:MAG: hypothetical protein FE042_00030 [Thermoplasmata archaeon]|nr:MAG: hypothetical protein FE042_00030 [Thermoplasmata archaeon]
MGELMGLFLSMLMLIFAVGTFLAGVFTAYFGTGRSRAVGALLVLIGIIVGYLYIDFTWLHYIGAFFTSRMFSVGIISIVGGLVGALISLGIFLAAIMKA